MISPEQYIAPEKRTASRILEKEAVILTLEDSMLHTLNRVGSRTWELADGTKTIEEIATIISDEFEIEKATAQADILEFVEELQGKGMISVRSTRTSEVK